MPKESTKATITSFAGTPLVRVVDGSNSRNISPANLVAESGAQTALDGRYVLQTDLDTDRPVPSLYLPGNTTDYVSCPDAAAFTPTTELDVRVAIAATDWSPGANTVLISQWGATAGASRSWMLYVNTSNVLTLALSDDDDTEAYPRSTIVIPFSDLDCYAVRAVWAVAGTVNFYYKATTPENAMTDVTADTGWTEMGSGSTGATVPTIALNNASTAVELGRRSALSGLAGFYSAALVEVDGATAGVWDARIMSDRQRDSVGNIWSLNGTSNGWSY